MSNSTSHKNLIGMGLAAAGFSFYSIGDVFLKQAGETYAPEQVAFMVNLFFLPMLLTMSGKVGGLAATLKTRHLKLHLLRALLGMGVFFSVMKGFQTLGMATSYTLLFAAPFISTILSIFFLKQKIGVYRWASIVMGFIGVLVVLRPGMIPLDLVAIGILGGACCFAGSTIIMRKIGEDEPLLAFSLYGCLFGLVVFGVMLIINDSFIRPPPEHLLLAFGTAIFHVFAGFWVSRAFSSADTSVVAPFHYVQLLWGIAFGYLLFDSPIDGWTAAGGAIIVGSGLYMIHRERVRHRQMTYGVVTRTGALFMEQVLEDEKRD